MTDIHAPTPEIAAANTTWTRNRTVIAGEDAVKAAGEAYLPKLPSQTVADYQAYKASVDFFPASRRTLDQYVGLIFRKPPTLVAPEGLEDFFETISVDQSLDDLACDLTRETFTTNFGGLLVDHPTATTAMSRATAFESGFRPFLAKYQAEAILEVSTSIVSNRRVISRVRLLDDAETVRELVLLDGIYTVVLHRRLGSGWVADEPITPLRDGRPLDAIPFFLISTASGVKPSAAPMDDICLLNLSHYRAQARLTNVIRHVANPIRWVTGVEADADTAINVSSDQVWCFDSPDTAVGMLEHSGAGVSSLQEHCDKLTDQLAAIGSRILAGEKAAAEAAETLAIRRASENSILASIANAVSSKIEAALNFAMEWAGLDAVSYRLNTDFVPTPMSPQELTALVSTVQAGLMSGETFFEALSAGEVINPSLAYDDERARIDRDQADRPPVDAL